mmetsp:Transcript_27669/g.57923  ORF Transcript_27669/g.57923 Transcript_27669/m.57923 type:complete len:345 (+) Transcript_27669:99-1133(+)
MLLRRASQVFAGAKIAVRGGTMKATNSTLVPSHSCSTHGPSIDRHMTTRNDTTKAPEHSEFYKKIHQHYSRDGDLMNTIRQGLESSPDVKDTSNLKPKDLAPVDAFHSRGRAATMELCELALHEGVNLSSRTRLLDVGCGLGGTARYLADTYECHVMGIDLTQEYITVGNELTQKVGLSDKVELKCANALHMSVVDPESFDVVWTEHVQMNIPDKLGFYQEIADKMKPGAHLVFHDVFFGSNTNENVSCPVPWAQEESMSQLAAVNEIQNAMKQAGLQILSWQDKTKPTVEYFTQVAAKIASNGPPPLGIHLLMGPTARDKLRNHVANLQNGRTTIVMGVAVKS